MNDNAQLPAGFTAVDPNQLFAIEGGVSPLGDALQTLGAVLRVIGEGIEKVGRWINGLLA